MKKLIIIRNGRGVVAEGDDMDELRVAYEEAMADHVARDVKREFTLPPFDNIEKCDHESETGMLCILSSEDSPNAAKNYHRVGFVD